MARSSARIIKNPFTCSTPSPRSLTQLFSVSSPLTSLFFSKKTSRSLSICILSFLFSFTFLVISLFRIFPNSQDSIQCSINSPTISPIVFASLLSSLHSNNEIRPEVSGTAMVPLPVHIVSGNLSEEETEFWKQPDGNGYRPCLDSTIGYRKRSARISIGSLSVFCVNWRDRIAVTASAISALKTFSILTTAAASTNPSWTR